MPFRALGVVSVRQDGSCWSLLFYFRILVSGRIYCGLVGAKICRPGYNSLCGCTRMRVIPESTVNLLNGVFEWR